MTLLLEDTECKENTATAISVQSLLAKDISDVLEHSRALQVRRIYILYPILFSQSEEPLDQSRPLHAIC